MKLMISINEMLKNRIANNFGLILRDGKILQRLTYKSGIVLCLKKK